MMQVCSFCKLLNVYCTFNFSCVVTTIMLVIHIFLTLVVHGPFAGLDLFDK